MNPRSLIAAALLATAAFSFAAPSAGPQQHPQVRAHPKVDANDKVYPIEQIVTASVHDAWMLSGKNEEAFFDIVEQAVRAVGTKTTASEKK
jgi:hypothetical protein